LLSIEYDSVNKCGKAYKKEPTAQSIELIAIALGICDLEQKYETSNVVIKLPTSRQPDSTPDTPLENSKRFSIVVTTLFL